MLAFLLRVVWFLYIDVSTKVLVLISMKWINIYLGFYSIPTHYEETIIITLITVRHFHLILYINNKHTRCVSYTHNPTINYRPISSFIDMYINERCVADL